MMGTARRRAFAHPAASRQHRGKVKGLFTRRVFTQFSFVLRMSE
jgi:hypothetical protein